MKKNTPGKLTTEGPKRVTGDGFTKKVIFEDPEEENSRVQGLEVTTG